MNLRIALTFHGVLVLLALVPASLVHADADDDFGLAQNLFRDAGDYATSAQLFAEFMRNYPGDPRQADAALLLARSYARSQRCADAVPAFEAFYEVHTEHVAAADARRERADCLQEIGSFGRAASGFEDVQRLYSEAQFAAASLLAAAANYVRAGDLSNAVRVYNKLLTTYTNRVEANRGRYRLAQLLFASGDAGTAQSLLASISVAAPGSNEARDALLLSGNIHLVLQRVGDAEATFKALHGAFAGTAQSDSAYLDLASHLLALGRYEDAVSRYAGAVKMVRDGHLQARARLGHADALRLVGRTAEALAEYGELNAAGSPVLGEVRLGQAIALGQSDHFGAAIGLFLQLAQAPSGLPPSAVAAAAVRELGALYRRQGDLARAASWFRRYLEDAKRFGDDFPESSADQDLARLQLAQVLAASGYHDKAVILFGELARGAGPLAGESQYGLAAAYEGVGARRLAIGEYGVFLQRYPGHVRATQVRQRVEYLREYSIVDPDRLVRSLQQGYIDELSGVPRQQVRLHAARALLEHQDFANAVRAWEAYAGSYSGDATAAEAQFYLADCLYRLSRQRQLEGDPASADSLHALALQEDRILASADAGRWSRLAHLRQIESAAATQVDTIRPRVLETGYAEFLAQHPLDEETAEARARALLGLGDARRQAASGDSVKLAAADSAYTLLLQEAASSPQALRARFGRSLVALQRGHTAVAIDSLSTLLPTLPGTALQPEALAILGRALVQANRHAEASTRLSELLLAFPDYAGRREAQELLGDTYLALGDPGRAAELFSVLSASDPTSDVSGSLRRRLAESQQQQGDAGAALAIFDGLLAEGAGDADSLQLARGRLLAGLGRVPEAIAAFGQVRSDALLPAARLGAADLHFAAGQFEQAASAYAPLLAGEIDAATMGHAVVSLYELGRREAADKMASQQLKRFGKDGVWPYLFRLYQGRYWLQQREYDKARKIFEAVAKEDGPLAHLDMGTGVPVLIQRMAAGPASAGAFLAVTSQWEQMRAEPTEEGTARALQAQANFVRQYPDSPFAADIYLRLAEFHLALDNLLPAAGAFRRVVDNPHATLAQKQDAIWQLLQCYTKLFQWDEALRITQRIQSSFPDHPRTTDVQLEIGYILKEMGQHTKAVAFLQKVLEWAEGEDAAEARFYIGEAYRNTGEYRKAITAFYQVAFHGAGASTQWINSADFERALCHVELGEFDTARTVYQRIIKREGSSSEWGRLARERVDQLPASTSRN
mgnify:CR=1 FL=1